ATGVAAALLRRCNHRIARVIATVAADRTAVDAGAIDRAIGDAELIAKAAPHRRLAHIRVDALVGLRRARGAAVRAGDVLVAQHAGPRRVVRRLHDAVAIAGDAGRVVVMRARPHAVIAGILDEAVDVGRARERCPRRAAVARLLRAGGLGRDDQVAIRAREEREAERIA